MENERCLTNIMQMKKVLCNEILAVDNYLSNDVISLNDKDSLLGMISLHKNFIISLIS